MNLTTRVRNLRKTTGWPYQKCLQAIRAAGAAPAEFARANGWSIDRADLAVIAPGFDIEQTAVVREAASRSSKHAGAQSRTAAATATGFLNEEGALSLIAKGMSDQVGRLDRARIDAERLDRARIDAERFDRVRIEAERFEGVCIEAERFDKACIEAERFDKARIEAERFDKACVEAERFDKVRIEAERFDKARIEAERFDKARIEAERFDKARIEAERFDKATSLADITMGMQDSMERLNKANTFGIAMGMQDSMERLNKANTFGIAMGMQDSMERLNKATTLAGITMGMHDSLERFNKATTLAGITMGMHDSLERFNKATTLAGITMGTTAMFREDRRQWLGLHTYDEIIPNFRMARTIAGGGFASVVESMAAANRLDAVTYGAILKEPSRAFTSYMERTGDLARTTGPRGREVLDLALAFGSTHFRSTSEVMARLLAQEAQVSTERMPKELMASDLDLLDLERDELMNRAALDEDASLTKVAEGADTVRLAESIRELLTCIVDCNEAARFRGKDNVFSHTNRSLRASARLPLLLPRDLNCLKEAVEHLYFLIYEAAGSDNLRFEAGKSECGVFQRTEDPFGAVMDLKFLRSKWLCHDPEHGGHGATNTYQDVMRVFERLGVSGEPASPEDYQKMYLRLVHRLHSFLEELRARLRRNFS